MCGIIWARRLNGKPVVGKIKKMFQNQIGRGTNGFGVVEIEKNAIVNFFRCQTQDEMFDEIRTSKATEMLFHHRTPTSTLNIAESNHPIPVVHKDLKYDYLGVHNGVISNDTMLRDKYEKLGYNFTTKVEECYRVNGVVYPTGKDKFNDSEALIIDVCRAIEDPTIKKLDSYGSIAFIVLQIDKVTHTPVKLFFGRNDRNPLNLQRTDHILSLTSMGEGEEVEEHKLFSLDYATGEFAFERDLEIGHKIIKYTPPVQKALLTPEKTPVWYKDRELCDLEDYDAESNFGFNLRNHFHKKNESKKTEEKENLGLIDEEFKMFEGYEQTGYHLKLTSTTLTMWFLYELENEWININEDIEHAKDMLKGYLKRGVEANDDAYETHCWLGVLKEDERTLYQELKYWMPEKFAKKEVKNVTEKTPEPIV